MGCHREGANDDVVGSTTVDVSTILRTKDGDAYDGIASQRRQRRQRIGVVTAKVL